MKSTQRADAAAYLVLGFGHLWMLVVLWGFARFPGDVASSAALGGAATLILVAGPLAFFARRLAALIALAAIAAEAYGTVLVFVRPRGSLWLLLPIIPLAAGFVVAARATRRPASVGAPSTGTRPFAAAALILVVYVLFFAVFDGASLLALLFGWKESL